MHTPKGLILPESEIRKALGVIPDPTPPGPEEPRAMLFLRPCCVPARVPVRATGFIEPCLLSPCREPPGDSDWLHEIKHDGYGVMIRRDGAGVRLLTRRGYDWTGRYPAIAAVANALRGKSFLIDGEAIGCDEGRVRFSGAPL
jgi:bifunctional non-homologous end joining protein LigD